MLLLDTNVLVYAHDSASRNNRRARRVLKSVLKGKLEAGISYQSLIELYTVLINPLKLERPCTPQEAAELCELYFKSKNLVKFLPTPKSYKDAVELAERTKATEAKIFDCLLAATAKENGADVICTKNTEDFEGFKFIKAVDPFKGKINL